MKATKGRARRKAFEDRIGKHWCKVFGVEDVHFQTVITLAAFARKHGTPQVKRWIEIASDKFIAGCDYADQRIGRYISGIRRRMIENGELKP